MDGKYLLAGLSLREAGRRRCRAEVLDMVVKSGQVEYRLIRRWFAEEKRVLSVDDEPTASSMVSRAGDVSLYRCRWQKVELLFKEWEIAQPASKGFCDGRESDAEG